MLKTTLLYRERIYLKLALDDYNELVRRGMRTWEAYKEHRLAIAKSINTNNRGQHPKVQRASLAYGIVLLGAVSR
jgi:hypothetical protein